MDVKEIESERLKRKYEIVLPLRKIAELEEEKLEEVRSTAHIRGFRPGKVPMSLIKKRFGDAVRSNVLDEHSKSVLEEFLKSKDEKPVAGLNVALADREDENSDYVLTVDYECTPEIPDVDLSLIEIEKLVADIDDDFVSQAMRDDMVRQPKFDEAPEGYAIQRGDGVHLSYRARSMDESSLQTDETSVDVIVDPVENNEESRLNAIKFDKVPHFLRSMIYDQLGMSDHLIGMKVGDTARIELDVPKHALNGPLSGKKAIFDIEIKSINKSSSDFDEEEFASWLDYDSAEAYRLELVARLKHYYEKLSKEIMVENLIQELSKKLEFDVPETLVDNEIKYHARRLAHAAPDDQESGSGDPSSSGSESGTPDAEADSGGGTAESEVENQIRKLAERRVRHFLFMEHLTEKHQISIESNEFLDFVKSIAGSETSLSSMLERCQKDAGYRQNIVNMATTDKTSNFVLELANSETKKVPPEDLIKISQERLDDSLAYGFRDGLDFV